jgi:hypothetical protein
MYGVYTVFLAGKSPHGHVRCICMVLANPSHVAPAFVSQLRLGWHDAQPFISHLQLYNFLVPHNPQPFISHLQPYNFSVPHNPQPFILHLQVYICFLCCTTHNFHIAPAIVHFTCCMTHQLSYCTAIVPHRCLGAQLMIRVGAQLMTRVGARPMIRVVLVHDS